MFIQKYYVSWRNMETNEKGVLVRKAEPRDKAYQFMIRQIRRDIQRGAKYEYDFVEAG